MIITRVQFCTASYHVEKLKKNALMRWVSIFHSNSPREPAFSLSNRLLTPLPRRFLPLYVLSNSWEAVSQFFSECRGEKSARLFCSRGESLDTERKSWVRTCNPNQGRGVTPKIEGVTPFQKKDPKLVALPRGPYLDSC